jgi:hypothetical protein
MAIGFGSFAFGAYTQTQSQVPSKVQKEAIMTTHASGAFEVKLNPQVDDKVGDPAIGRLSIDKQFHGALEATSKGQMLATRTAVEGSAGYVAMEVVSGTLNGRTGTFALQHSGLMTRGAPQLSVTVVPDSGTGQLVGLAGKMTINIVDGKHLYDFEYTIAEAQ